MRTLTSEQKRQLRVWFNQNYPHHTGHCKFDLADKMESVDYDRIEGLNPTEIHYQNVEE